MKRIGYLYDKMADKKLIRQTIISGSRGKRGRWDVKMVLKDVDGYTDKMYDLIVNRSYTPTIPKSKEIHDSSSGKLRKIKIVPYFPDGIMHQLVVEVCKPAFMRGMYRWSCASIPRRGNMAAVRYLTRALSKRPSRTKYAAKLDIRHYYDNIDSDKLIAALGRKIKDREMIDLIRAIVDSDPDPGLAIGYYICQWLANFYLEPLDHFIADLDGVNAYVRNMDDMVLLSSNKRKLHRAVFAISMFLSDLGLELKPNWQVFKTDSRGIDFVGYRFFHGYTKLRRRNFLKLTRQSRRIQKKKECNEEISFHEAAGMLSRAGALKHCSGTAIRKKYIDDIKVKSLKDIVREHSRELSKELSRSAGVVVADGVEA